jgi:hypothetical protein
MYLNEKFMYIAHVTPYSWYDDSDKCNYVPLNKGEGHVYAGVEIGFIKSIFLFFKSSSKPVIIVRKWSEKYLK